MISLHKAKHEVMELLRVVSWRWFWRCRCGGGVQVGWVVVKRDRGLAQGRSFPHRHFSYVVKGRHDSQRFFPASI